MSGTLSREALVASVEKVLGEVISSVGRFGGFNSSHEALGVLEEEYDELKDAIRANDIRAIAKEAMQVSAVALRLLDVADRAAAGLADGFLDRSGCKEYRR